jgi:hypothetical protein
MASSNCRATDTRSRSLLASDEIAPVGGRVGTNSNVGVGAHKPSQCRHLCGRTKIKDAARSVGRARLRALMQAAAPPERARRRCCRRVSSLPVNRSVCFRSTPWSSLCGSPRKPRPESSRRPHVLRHDRHVACGALASITSVVSSGAVSNSNSNVAVGYQDRLQRCDRLANRNSNVAVGVPTQPQLQLQRCGWSADGSLVLPLIDNSGLDCSTGPDLGSPDSCSPAEPTPAGTCSARVVRLGAPTRAARPS